MWEHDPAMFLARRRRRRRLHSSGNNASCWVLLAPSVRAGAKEILFFKNCFLSGLRNFHVILLHFACAMLME
jgi:hypothetical protein